MRDLELYKGVEQAFAAARATALMDRLAQQPGQHLAATRDRQTPPS